MPGKSIWVIEDEELGQNLLKLQLANEGYDIHLFDNAVAALRQLSQGSTPDLILLDIMLPEMSGLDFLDHIRQEYQVLEIPIIILSALNANDTVVEGLHRGANDYLIKPYHPAELKARIQTQLQLKSLTEKNHDRIKALEEEEQIKDQAITIASHDIKGPLGTIMCGLEMLEDISPKAEEDKLVYATLIESMYEASNMIGPIVNRFLNVQAIKSERLQLRRDFVSINMLIRDVATQYHNTAAQKGVKLNVDLTPELPDIYGDFLRLKQVLGNLVNNALKHTPQNSEVRISSMFTGSSIYVEVTDEGPGIAEKDLSNLFKPFAQVSKRHDSNGTGVGLYISQQLIAMHGGELDVKADGTEGGVFWFEIPTSDEDSQESIANLERSGNRYQG